jgi:broad specificity phosphatase PhoE
MSKTMSEADRRSRRRRRRIQVVMIYMAIALGLAWFFESQSTTTVIFVRHAEKMAEPSNDPGLSEAGRQRAAELARQLVDADVVAGVDAIYSTSYRRTEETARPVAEALSLPILSYDASNTETIMDEIVKKHKGKIILVVGHSNTIPALIGNMGASKKVPEINEDEYDNIYIVSIPWFGKTKTIRLRYGTPYIPAE